MRMFSLGRFKAKSIIALFWLLSGTAGISKASEGQDPTNQQLLERISQLEAKVKQLLWRLRKSRKCWDHSGGHQE
jgi:hypothetical protein